MQAIVTAEMKHRGETAKVGAILTLSDGEFNDLKQYNKVAPYVSPVVEASPAPAPIVAPAETSNKAAPKLNTRTPRGK